MSFHTYDHVSILLLLGMFVAMLLVIVLFCENVPPSRLAFFFFFLNYTTSVYVVYALRLPSNLTQNCAVHYQAKCYKMTEKRLNVVMVCGKCEGLECVFLAVFNSRPGCPLPSPSPPVPAVSPRLPLAPWALLACPLGWTHQAAMTSSYCPLSLESMGTGRHAQETHSWINT